MCNLDKFKERTKCLCAENGIQLKFVHQKLGRGATYLNDAWRGKTTLSDSEYDIVADILNTTSAYLRGETDDPAPEASTEGDWVDEIKISPAKLAFAKRLAEMDDSLASTLSGLSSLDKATLLRLEKIADALLKEE